MALADDMAAAATRHSIYLERYKARVVREVIEALDPTLTAIERDILRSSIEAMNRRELDRLLSAIRRRIKDGYAPVIELIDGRVREIGQYEAQWQLDLFRSVVPIELDFTSPADEQIYAATVARPFNGRLLREWYQGLEDGAFRRIRAAIRTGYVEGQTTQQIVRAVMDANSEQSRRGAEAATRTALAHTANVARNETYRANKTLIKGVEWVSTLDGRTSAICRARDGQLYPVDAGPRPPAHPNCRSTTVPVIKSARALGLRNLPSSTRASMNGQVSGELNYDAWLRTQPRDFQDEVLGVTRGKLFREGLTMDRFVDRSGQEYTLDEFRQRDRAIWDAATGG